MGSRSTNRFEMVTRTAVLVFLFACAVLAQRPMNGSDRLSGKYVRTWHHIDIGQVSHRVRQGQRQTAGATLWTALHSSVSINRPDNFYFILWYPTSASSHSRKTLASLGRPSRWGMYIHRHVREGSLVPFGTSVDLIPIGWRISIGRPEESGEDTL